MYTNLQVEESLKAKIAELTVETFDQQRDINNLEAEVSEARQQAELAFRYTPWTQSGTLHGHSQVHPMDTVRYTPWTQSGTLHGHSQVHSIDTVRYTP